MPSGNRVWYIVLQSPTGAMAKGSASQFVGGINMFKHTLSMVGLAISLSGLAVAQEPEANIAIGYDLDVKMGHQAEFEAAIKEQVSWYHRNNETWSWHTWQWVTGENSGGYVFRSPGHTLADFDRRSERTSRAREQFLEVVGPHLNSIEGAMGAVQTKISDWPEDLGEVPLVTVYRYQVHYGMAQEFEHAITKIHEAIQEANWGIKYAWVAKMNGGELPTYVLVIPHKNFQDMAPPDKPFWKMLDEQVGRTESDALRAALLKCVREQTSGLALFRADLSYMPDAGQ